MRNLPRLLLGVVLLAPLLAGCAFSDPRIDASVPPVPSQPQAFIDDLAEADDSLRVTWEIMAGMADAEPANPQWLRIADTLEAQWRVVVGPDPITRIPSTTAEIGDPAQVTNLPQAIHDADEMLATIREEDLGFAGTSSGVRAVFWASLAASAEQMRLGLHANYAPPIPADPVVTVTIMDESAAWAELVADYHEGIFALKTATGFLDPAGWEYPVFDAAWRQLSADVEVLSEASPSADTPLPSLAPAYDLPPGRDSAAAMDLLAATQRGLVEGAACWVASAKDPTVAAGYVVRAATMAVNQGIGFAVWPGWPDA